MQGSRLTFRRCISMELGSVIEDDSGQSAYAAVSNQKFEFLLSV